jgi:hypothetical protein
MRYTKVVGQRTTESALFDILPKVRKMLELHLPEESRRHTIHLVYATQGFISGTRFDEGLSLTPAAEGRS